MSLKTLLPTLGQADERVFIIDSLLNVKKFNMPVLLGLLFSPLPSLTPSAAHGISLPLSEAGAAQR